MRKMNERRVRRYAETIMAFAECNMQIEGTAMRLGLHRNAIADRLSRIYKVTKLNPKNYYDLGKLIEAVEDGRLCEICRMTRS